MGAIADPEIVRERLLTAKGDEIVPFHYFDDFFHNRALLLDFTYRFDDVLDPWKLKGSLERLVSLEGWNKLGGRVRLNERGKLEYHIPKHLDEQRPAFLFHYELHDESIEQHPLASKLPRARSVPSIFQDPRDFHSFAHPDHPLQIEDWIYSDRPPLSLSIWSFCDATLLTLSFSHTLFDAVGHQCLFKAWTAVLNGHEEEVPPFVGFREDPLDSIAGKVPAEKHVLHSRILTETGFHLFVNYSILEAIRHPNKANRVIQLPPAYVQKLREEVKRDLKRLYPEDDIPFLSDGDVLFAWWIKIAVKALDIPPCRTIALNNVFNFSGLIDDAVPPGSAYIGNLAASILTPMTAQEVNQASFGEIALALRKSLLEQRSTEQVMALVTLHKQHVQATGRPPLFGTYDQVMAAWSNWYAYCEILLDDDCEKVTPNGRHRAKFFDFDFSGAVVKQGMPDDQRQIPVGRPSLISLTGHENGFQVRCGGSLMGRDAAGNWWIQYALRAEAWPAVEKEIEALACSC